VRVIAGTAKGRRLAPAPPGTRPVSDRVREGIFSSIAVDVVDAHCLDLFAGTGAMGIEALSRGASGCDFVEHSRRAAAAIRGNLQATGLAELGRVHQAEVADFAARATPDPVPTVVLLDPPYDADQRFLTELLVFLDERWLLEGGWTLVMTRGHKSPWPAVPVHWAARRRLRYGDSLAIVYQEGGWA